MHRSSYIGRRICSRFQLYHNTSSVNASKYCVAQQRTQLLYIGDSQPFYDHVSPSVFRQISTYPEISYDKKAE